MHNQQKNNPVVHDPLLRRAKIAFRNAGAMALLPMAKVGNRIWNYVPVLSYHRILPDFPKGSIRTASISLRQFEDQMQYLQARGYASLSLTEFEGIIRGSMPVPEKSVMITFDDGYADNYHHAFRIASQHGVTINCFLPTQIIGVADWPFFWDKRTPQEERHMAAYPDLWRPLTWDEVRKMQSGGAHFGCHGHTHRKLSTLSGEELKLEITQSISFFEEHMGSRPKCFSIPWGDEGSYTNETLEVLQKNGIGIIFTTEAKRIKLPAQGSLFPRISIREQDDIGSFSRKIQGAHDLLRLMC